MLTEMALLSEPKPRWEVLSGPLSLRDHGLWLLRASEGLGLAAGLRQALVSCCWVLRLLILLLSEDSWPTFTFLGFREPVSPERELFGVIKTESTKPSRSPWTWEVQSPSDFTCSVFA
jgi:hypothetical protein